jgi:hypothetical protein
MKMDIPTGLAKPDLDKQDTAKTRVHKQSETILVSMKQNLFCQKFTNFNNKLECFVTLTIGGVNAIKTFFI